MTRYFISRSIFSSFVVPAPGMGVSYILEHTAADGKTYQTKFYNLDATKKIFPGEYDISV